jgi:MoaA/NifB/PqqE/SkfB family radical SAM enzyme
MNVSILYRGPLSSCNYGCTYCPFAKTKNTRAELADDARKLQKFIAWIADRKEHNFGILFTPWGEALIRKYYQHGIIELSKLPNVQKVAIQTNLSGSLQWLQNCDKQKVALWTTYHPSEVSRTRFLNQCKQLDTLQIRYSVGVVGFKEALDEITLLRQALSPEVYVWINAYKREPHYYQERDMQHLLQIDPLFSFNLKYHPSQGKACQAGESVFSVDGEGNMYRCHFIKTQIGNIYEANFEQHLFPRLCTNATCGCHIGYIHLDELNLYPVYGTGLLERIPSTKIW